MAWRQALQQELPSDAVRVYNADQFAALLAPEQNDRTAKAASKYGSRAAPGMNGSSRMTTAGAAIAGSSTSGAAPGSTLSQQNSVSSSAAAVPSVNATAVLSGSISSRPRKGECR